MRATLLALVATALFAGAAALAFAGRTVTAALGQTAATHPQSILKADPRGHYDASACLVNVHRRTAPEGHFFTTVCLIQIKRMPILSPPAIARHQTCAGECALALDQG